MDEILPGAEEKKEEYRVHLAQQPSSLSLL